MGSDPIALPLLEHLHSEGADHYQLEAVVTQPDRPRGRGKRLQPNAIAAFAESNKLLTQKPEKPGSELRQWLAENSIDMAIVMAYGHLIGRSLLETPRLGFINLHTSILPKYRGASPIETAIANGETETGVSLMRMELAMDAGPVLDVERVPIGPQSTSETMRRLLAEATVPLVRRNMEALLSGTARFVEQPNAGITYCRKLDKADGLIDFNASAQTLAQRVNGLFPWPGCYCYYGDTRLKLQGAIAISNTPSNQPGAVIRADATGVLIGTGNGELQIAQLQRPGGKLLPAREFIQGFPLPPGTQLTGGPLRPLLIE